MKVEELYGKKNIFVEYIKRNFTKDKKKIDDILSTFWHKLCELEFNNKLPDKEIGYYINTLRNLYYHEYNVRKYKEANNTFIELDIKDNDSEDIKDTLKDKEVDFHEIYKLEEELISDVKSSFKGYNSRRSFFIFELLKLKIGGKSAAQISRETGIKTAVILRAIDEAKVIMKSRHGKKWKELLKIKNDNGL